MTTSTVLSFPERPDPEFDVHDRLRKIRRTAGMTQEAFASVLNIGVKSLGAYEAGTRTPPADELDRMARQIRRVFGYRSEWVKNGTGPSDDGGHALLAQGIEQPPPKRNVTGLWPRETRRLRVTAAAA